MPRSDTQFKPGNPGRPKGARSKLGESFIAAIAQDFEEHGLEALIEMREKRPSDYIKVVAGLLPKDARLELGTGKETLSGILASISGEGVRRRE